jgi:probable HAF family extracellular repeat protein
MRGLVPILAGTALLGGSGWRIADLGTVGPAFRDSSAAAIDDRGEIAGTSGTAGGAQRATLWANGKPRSLGTLGGRDSAASLISSRGWVAGTSLTRTPARTHAFLWHGGKLTDLGTLGGAESDAAAINRSGEIVGVANTRRGVRHAVAWLPR